MKISLCLLTWNEIGGCRIDVPHLPVSAFEEVFAVDGGSTDGTVEYLVSKGIPVYRQPKNGLNAAYIHAVSLSRCDAIVFFFPKGTIETSTLQSFRQLFDQGNELVVASRNIAGAKNEEDSFILKPRKWGIYFLAVFAAMIWKRDGPVIRDVLHGYKGITIPAFKMIDPLDYGLSIDLETVVRSYKLNIQRVEFPVSEVARPFGVTRFKIIPTAIKLARYLIWELTSRR